jgi:hypothetical protein
MFALWRSRASTDRPLAGVADLRHGAAHVGGSGANCEGAAARAAAGCLPTAALEQFKAGLAVPKMRLGIRDREGRRIESRPLQGFEFVAGFVWLTCGGESGGIGWLPWWRLCPSPRTPLTTWGGLPLYSIS